MWWKVVVVGIALVSFILGMFSGRKIERRINAGEITLWIDRATKAGEDWHECELVLMQVKEHFSKNPNCKPD